MKFILQKSLLEASSTVTREDLLFSSWFMCLTLVSEELCIKSNINEVLWNFSRCKDDKRLTLKQNPHFYTPLPRSSGQYGGKYESDPIEEFQHDTISVLTDGLGRVHMEVAKKRRTFGGIWVANNVIIFKGSSLSVRYCSPLVSSFQTSVENSRAKVSLEVPFRTRTYRVLT